MRQFWKMLWLYVILYLNLAAYAWNVQKEELAQQTDTTLVCALTVKLKRGVD